MVAVARTRVSSEADEPASADAAAHARPSRATVADMVAALARGETTLPGLPANQAVVRLLAQAVAAPSPTPTAPAPAVPVGLASGQRIEDYVDGVRSFAEAPGNRDKPVVALVRHAFTVANEHLAAIGVPAVDGRIGAISTAAHFVGKDWSMTVDASRFALDTGEPPTVGGVDPSTLVELAGSVYHEARHAEQTFRQARLLAGQHHAELNPTFEADPEDSLALLVKKARVATLERQLVVAELALELVVPVRIMELATERPLLPLDDPLTRFVGTVLYGLRGLTVMDLFQPWALYPRAAAAAERGVAQHEAVVEETERWAAQEDLEDLVYDRSKTIHTTLQALLGEAQKAGGPDGMDLATIEAQRKPLQEIVESIDRELRRLRGDPGRREMVDLLEELRAKLYDIAESIIALRDLEKEPPTRGRAAAIARHVKIVGLLVRLVELHLKGQMYERLLLELDAYQQAARVRAAWGGAPSAP